MQGWVNSTVDEEQWHKIQERNTVDTASDSGANIHVVSKAVVEAKGWKMYTEKTPYKIQFGKKAPSPKLHNIF
jgi:hypothetical protein